MNDSSRRTFLQVVAAGSASACLGGLPGCTSGPAGIIAAGNVADIAVGEAVAISGQMVALFRDADGLWATTTICTHLQCDMQELGSVGADELVCDCHDSVFTPDGDRVSGPANAPLDNYAVTVDDAGDITIDADTVVDAGTRTEAPATT